MTWTPEQLETALQWWREGQTASSIGQRLGVTRNTVIGRIHRELVRRGEHVRKARPKRENGLRAKPKVAPVPKLPVVAFKVPAVREVPKVPAVPRERRITDGCAGILDVTGCRFAVAEDRAVKGGHLFCNADLVEGSSWCPEHHGRVFNPRVKVAA